MRFIVQVLQVYIFSFSSAMNHNLQYVTQPATFVNVIPQIMHFVELLWVIFRNHTYVYIIN